jgi:hypothetical protein
MVFNIYLDIDGVLLANEQNPANYAPEFLKYVLTNYPNSTYWLTTHCQGDASVPVQRFGHLFDAETVALMGRIKPTSWDTAKTEAIDFSKPFLWCDDDLFSEEILTLQKHNAMDRWIEIDLAKNENQLLDVLNYLKEKYPQ